MNETHTPPKTIAVVLGRNAELSVREIESTLERARCRVIDLTVASGVALVKATPPPDEQWFLRLGGAVKFGFVLATLASDEAALIDAVQTQLGPSRDLGLSASGSGVSLLNLSKALKYAGLCRRYVLPQAGTVLSAAQSKQLRAENDRELLILADGDSWQLIEIRAVQDIDEQTRRDRLAPEAHAERGMLPTKLARIMVNLGLGLVPNPPAGGANPVVLDPFCGTGRILMEAQLLGVDSLGADIDPVAVKATIRNLEWLAQTYHLELHSWEERVLQSDIRDLPKLLPGSADVIVTEPHLGPPQRGQLSSQQIDQLFSDLEPTYESFLSISQKLLKSGGGIVTVFPTVGTRSLLERFVDKFSGFGYHVDSSIRVERPDQIISRDIVILSTIADRRL